MRLRFLTLLVLAALLLLPGAALAQDRHRAEYIVETVNAELE